MRQRQKAHRRAHIIAAGRALLFSQGYAATSMKAIAEQAEVGVATVYNYFGSKGGGFADILRPPKDPVAGVMGLIAIYRQFQSNWDKKDALLAVIGPGLSAEPVLDDLAAYTEHQVKDQLESLILYYQKRELVRSAINVTDGATIIFFIFNQNFIEYIIHADEDY